MRGRPVAELLVALTLIILGIIPVQFLTRTPSGLADAGEGAEDLARSEVWIELRSSHAPESWSIWHEGQQLWTGGGDTRADADLELHVHGGQIQLEVSGSWPDLEDSAYVEIRVEPDGLEDRRAGAWAKQEFRKNFQWSWE